MKNIELLENLNYIQYQINDGIDKVIKYIYLKYIRNKTYNDNDTNNDKMTLEKFKKSILKPMRKKINNYNNNNDSH